MEAFTIGALITLVKLTYDLTKDIAGKIVENRKAYRSAVSALSVAVSSTENYLRYLQDGGEQKKFHENHLSKLWDQAAAALLPVVGNDHARVKPLEFKAEYWRDPEAWSAADIEEARIGLSRIREELKQYLRKSENPA